MRCYTKQYDNIQDIPWKSYLKVKHRYVKCVLMLNFDNDVIGISPCPRNYAAPGSGLLESSLFIQTNDRHATPAFWPPFLNPYKILSQLKDGIASLLLRLSFAHITNPLLSM